jgi:hypothetical protein
VKLGFCELDRATTDIEGSACIPRYGSDLSRRKLYGVGFNDVPWDAFEAGLYDFH